MARAAGAARPGDRDRQQHQGQGRHRADRREGAGQAVAHPRHPRAAHRVLRRGRQGQGRPAPRTPRPRSPRRRSRPWCGPRGSRTGRSRSTAGSRPGCDSAKSAPAAAASLLPSSSDHRAEAEGGDHLQQEQPPDRRDRPVPGQVQVEVDRPGGDKQPGPGQPGTRSAAGPGPALHRLVSTPMVAFIPFSTPAASVRFKTRGGPGLSSRTRRGGAPRTGGCRGRPRRGPSVPGRGSGRRRSACQCPARTPSRCGTPARRHPR